MDMGSNRGIGMGSNRGQGNNIEGNNMVQDRVESPIENNTFSPKADIPW
jgi:hypothetical protein